MKQFKPSPWCCVLACVLALCLALAPGLVAQVQAATSGEAHETITCDADITVTISYDDTVYFDFTPSTTGWYEINYEWSEVSGMYTNLRYYCSTEGYVSLSYSGYMLPCQAGETYTLCAYLSDANDTVDTSTATADLTISASLYSTTEVSIDTSYSGSSTFMDRTYYAFTPSMTSTYTFDFYLSTDGSSMFEFNFEFYDNGINYVSSPVYTTGSTGESASYSYELTAGTTYFICLCGTYLEYTFTVTNSNPVDISSATVTLSTTSYTYNGSARKPTPTVTLDGMTLTKGTDYTVSYSSGRKNVGTYKVTVKGCGNYTGTATATFTIKAKSVSSATVKLAYSSTTYSGKAKKPSVKSVKLTLNGSTKTLTKGTDYTVSYSSNTKVGTATVKITGTGNYKGTVKKTFKITPKTVTVKSVKSSAKKKATVKWTKLSSANVTKYQIRYRVKGTSTWKTVKVSSSKSSYTLTGLKSGKTY